MQMTPDQTTPVQTPPVGRPQLRQWELTVTAVADAPANMRRVTFTAPDIAEFTYRAGQAIVMMLPTGDGEFGRRDYTIRSLDKEKGLLDVDFFMHGDGTHLTPGPAFARDAKIGDKISVRGPRGGASFREDADWHLITGDECCIPAIFHILETMPAKAQMHVLIEVDSVASQIALNDVREGLSATQITWLHRGDQKAGPSDLMAEAVAGFMLPHGRGHAILIGETSNVRKQRQNLISRGLTREQIASEGYWRPGRIGGHDHVED